MTSSIKDVLIKVKDENKMKVNSLYQNITIKYPLVRIIKISDNCLQFYIQDSDSAKSTAAFIAIVVHSGMQEITINNIVNEPEEDECTDCDYEFFCKDPADIIDIFRKRSMGGAVEDKIELLKSIKSVNQFVELLAGVMDLSTGSNDTDSSNKSDTTENHTERSYRQLLVGKDNEIYSSVDSKAYFAHPNTLVIIPLNNDSKSRIQNYLLHHQYFKGTQAGEQFQLYFENAMQVFEARNKLSEAGVI